MNIKVIDAGHVYDLKLMDQVYQNEDAYVRFNFIKKIPKEAGSTELITDINGTTSEAVLEMMIDRMNYLQGVIACPENALVISHLTDALQLLNARTAKRVEAGVEGTAEVVAEPVI